MKLLHIDSSISGEQSVSRQLTASIVAQLKHTTPNLEITYRDLIATPVPHHTPAVWLRKIQGDIADQQVVDLQAEKDFASINDALNEFLAADLIVIGAPMYNFGVPSQLKAWIDALAAAGKTFHYTSQGPEGLSGDKKIIIASSRGNMYASPSPLAQFDHQETFLEHFFQFLGVRDITIVRAEGTMMGEQRQHAISAALDTITALKVA